jgi:RNA polymerase sigma factor (sigma-70 family)
MTSRPEMTDQELLRAYVDSSDVESLGAFLRRYQGSLLRFAQKLLGDADAAQDVVQDTFIVVARHPRRLLDVKSCHNGLLRVVRNLGVSRIRRETRHRRHAEVFQEASRARALDRQASAAPATETEEGRAWVRSEVDRLKPRTREVLLLKVQEGKSYKEIAEITGLSVTNVGYILHMALKELGTRLTHAREVLS